MNIRTPDSIFNSTEAKARSNEDLGEMPFILSNRVEAESADPDVQVALAADAPQPEDSKERFLLVCKTQQMVTHVRDAVGSDAEVSIEVAQDSLLELAHKGADALGDHDIVVLEIDPAHPGEMTALRAITASAPGTTRFLAITPEELTLSVARNLMESGILEVLPMTSIRPKNTAGAVIAPPAAVQARNGMVLTIAQTRGGIGATTLAINLATMLSAPASRRDTAPGAKVALLDLDFQNGDAAASLDIEDNGALLELLKTQAMPDAAFLSRAMMPYNEKFDVLPTPVEFAPFDAMRPEVMAQLISELRNMYDYVILGLPRSMVLWLAPVLARADQMLLVTDTSVTGVRQARRLIDFYTEDNPGLPLDLVVSRAKKPGSLPKAVKEAAKFLEKPFDIWLPNDTRAATKATERGVPMVDAAKRSAVVKPLRAVQAKLEAIHASNKRREA